MRRSFLVGLVPALAFAAVSLASTKEAHAGPKLDVDLDLGTAFQNRVDFSLGGGARLGYRFAINHSFVWIQPEIGGHYMRFGFNSRDVGYDYAGTINGGLKVGLQGIVQPNLFGHLGLGILGYNAAGAGQIAGYFGPEADIGAGIDFKLAPGFTLGAQVAFNTVAVPSSNTLEAAKWMNFGLTAGFHFFDAPPRRTYVRRY
jgi:hypothetical protein